MNSKYSFRKGWSQVRQGDANAVREKLKEALNVYTRGGFLNRLNGKVVPLVPDKEAIDQVFAEYGITDVWGDIPCNTKVNEEG